jgi:hypothetical protein
MRKHPDRMIQLERVVCLLAQGVVQVARAVDAIRRMLR